MVKNRVFLTACVFLGFSCVSCLSPVGDPKNSIDHLGTSAGDLGSTSDSTHGSASSKSSDTGQSTGSKDTSSDTPDNHPQCEEGALGFCKRDQQVGDCVWGQRTCRMGQWSECEVWATPQQERCGHRLDVEGVKWTGDENCDGVVDESVAGRPGPFGCSKMMLDADGDGFGKIGVDLQELAQGDDPSKLATACFCTEGPQAEKLKNEGWVQLVENRANLDCGDCEREVYPEQVEFVSQASACLIQQDWKGGSHDYNCNGRSELQHPDILSCSGPVDNCVQEGGHWASEQVPSCGAEGKLGRCTSMGNPPKDPDLEYSEVSSFCVPVEFIDRTEVQRCR